MADVLMGYFFVHGPLAGSRVPPGSGRHLGLLVVTSCLLYTAGMVLNDVFDAPLDARERPLRPIPSGRIAPAAARRLGFVLLGAGTAAGWAAAGLLAAPRTALITTGLAALVLLYDAFLKHTPVGPLAMGGCRALNVLLGMSLSPTTWDGGNGLVAGGIGVYVVGITLLAQTEAGTSRRRQLALATLVLLAGLALIAWLPAWRSIRVEAARWRLFWTLLAGLIGWRCLQALLLPVPVRVQRAVRNAIHALIVIDAAICFSVQGTAWALAILALIVPTLWLGRWFPST